MTLFLCPYLQYYYCFNKQNKPILGNVLAIACADAFTSIICGTTVFSVLGYIAKSQSKQIDDILQQGPGLVFMVILDYLIYKYIITKN